MRPSEQTPSVFWFLFHVEKELALQGETLETGAWEAVPHKKQGRDVSRPYPPPGRRNSPVPRRKPGNYRQITCPPAAVMAALASSRVEST